MNTFWAIRARLFRCYAGFRKKCLRIAVCRLLYAQLARAAYRAVLNNSLFFGEIVVFYLKGYEQVGDGFWYHEHTNEGNLLHKQYNG